MARAATDFNSAIVEDIYGNFLAWYAHSILKKPPFRKSRALEIIIEKSVLTRDRANDSGASSRMLDYALRKTWRMSGKSLDLLKTLQSKLQEGMSSFRL